MNWKCAIISLLISNLSSEQQASCHGKEPFRKNYMDFGQCVYSLSRTLRYDKQVNMKLTRTTNIYPMIPSRLFWKASFLLTRWGNTNWDLRSAHETPCKAYAVSFWDPYTALQNPDQSWRFFAGLEGQYKNYQAWSPDGYIVDHEGTRHEKWVDRRSSGPF